MPVVGHKTGISAEHGSLIEGLAVSAGTFWFSSNSANCHTIDQVDIEKNLGLSRQFGTHASARMSSLASIWQV